MVTIVPKKINDTALSTTSTNSVQNQAITNNLPFKQAVGITIAVNDWIDNTDGVDTPSAPATYYVSLTDTRFIYKNTVDSVEINSIGTVDAPDIWYYYCKQPLPTVGTSDDETPCNLILSCQSKPMVPISVIVHLIQANNIMSERDYNTYDLSTETGDINYRLVNNPARNRSLLVDFGTVTNLVTQSYSVPGMTDDMIVDYYMAGDPSSFKSQITVTTSNNQVTLSTSQSGSSTLKIKFTSCSTVTATTI